MPNHNAMHHNNTTVEDHHDALIYQTYPCGYYVQSPSTLSYANSAAADIRSNIQNDAGSTFHSPVRSETHPLNPAHEDDPSRFALCRYSSSRGSSHSFLHHKKISYDGTDATENGDINRPVIVDGCGGDEDNDNDEEDDEKLFFDYYYGNGKGGWKRYFSYSYADSCGWICLQMSWRLMVSFGIALLVFYIATKPPPPNFSLEVSTLAS